MNIFSASCAKKLNRGWHQHCWVGFITLHDDDDDDDEDDVDHDNHDHDDDEDD